MGFTPDEPEEAEMGTLTTHTTLNGKPLIQRIWFTSVDGGIAEITGDPNAINALKALFERNGITYDEQSASWDAGYEDSDGRAADAD